VKDPKRVQERLMEEAAAVIQRKSGRYRTLLGILLVPPGQVYAERPATYYPTPMYDSYTAAESDQVNVPDRGTVTTQSARKSRTFFYNGLDPNGFDAVINPVVIEPVVQFTLYLKVRYDIEPAKAKPKAK
jgi:hypothetical protein